VIISSLYKTKAMRILYSVVYWFCLDVRTDKCSCIFERGKTSKNIFKMHFFILSSFLDNCFMSENVFKYWLS
jgi:hypothetical protein